MTPAGQFADAVLHFPQRLRRDAPLRLAAADLGMRVEVVLEDGTTEWVRPVHPDEAFLDDERVARLHLKKLGADRAGAKGPAIEVSGGLRLSNVREFALPGVSFLSVGALTHSARAVDLSFELEPIS